MNGKSNARVVQQDAGGRASKGRDECIREEMKRGSRLHLIFTLCEIHVAVDIQRHHFTPRDYLSPSNEKGKRIKEGR